MIIKAHKGHDIFSRHSVHTIKHPHPPASMQRARTATRSNSRKRENNVICNFTGHAPGAVAAPPGGTESDHAFVLSPTIVLSRSGAVWPSGYDVCLGIWSTRVRIPLRLLFFFLGITIFFPSLAAPSVVPRRRREAAVVGVLRSARACVPI